MRTQVLHSVGLAFLPSCIIVSHGNTGEAIIVVSELPVFLSGYIYNVYFIREIMLQRKYQPKQVWIEVTH